MKSNGKRCRRFSPGLHMHEHSHSHLYILVSHTHLHTHTYTLQYIHIHTQIWWGNLRPIWCCKQRCPQWSVWSPRKNKNILLRESYIWLGGKWYLAQKWNSNHPKRDRGRFHSLRISIVPIPQGKVDQKAFPFPNLNSSGNNDTQHTMCHLQHWPHL